MAKVKAYFWLLCSPAPDSGQAEQHLGMWTWDPIHNPSSILQEQSWSHLLPSINSNAETTENLRATSASLPSTLQFRASFKWLQVQSRISLTGVEKRKIPATLSQLLSTPRGTHRVSPSALFGVGITAQLRTSNKWVQMWREHGSRLKWDPGAEAAGPRKDCEEEGRAVHVPGGPTPALPHAGCSEH